MDLPLSIELLPKTPRCLKEDCDNRALAGTFYCSEECSNLDVHRCKGCRSAIEYPTESTLFCSQECYLKVKEELHCNGS